jgi:putative SOS response-associated peptidase YedK
MAKIHNTAKRMPVVLRPDLEKRWLDQDLLKEEIKDLMLPLEDGILEAHPVSKLITSRKESSNQPRVMEAVHYDGLEDVLR